MSAALHGSAKKENPRRMADSRIAQPVPRSHGDRCSRLHNRPTVSQTLLLQNMYQNPYVNQQVGPDGYPVQPDHRKVQEHYEVG